MRLLFLLCIASIAVHAGFGMNTSIVEMKVSRGEHNGWAEIAHISGKFPHAIELSVTERDLDLDGNVKSSQNPAKDFTVYPSQMLLTPGKKAKVQVIYKGQKLEADRAYILSVKEVPLPAGHKEEKLKMGLAVLVNYNVNILMDTGKPSSLTFVSSQTLDSGKVEVIMENKGKGRFSFQDKNLYIGKEKIASFTGGKNAVMPGQQRRFVFKHPRAAKANEVRFAK